MPPVPFGADQVQPAGTAVPYDAPEAEGWVEISFGEVTWDADEVIADANMFNDPPGEGHRYLMVTMDATYRGPGSLDAWVWVQVEYVTEDGTAHPQTRVVTPEYVSGGHGQVGEGESFTEEVVFEVPEHSREGGRFVIGSWGTATEDGTWVEAA